MGGVTGVGWQTVAQSLDWHAIPFGIIALAIVIAVVIAYKCGVRFRSDQTPGAILAVGAAVFAVMTQPTTVGVFAALLFIGFGTWQSILAEQRAKQLLAPTRLRVRTRSETIGHELVNGSVRVQNMRKKAYAAYGSDQQEKLEKYHDRDAALASAYYSHVPEIRQLFTEYPVCRVRFDKEVLVILDEVTVGVEAIEKVGQQMLDVAARL